jgi:hypothetical protein
MEVRLFAVRTRAVKSIHNWDSPDSARLADELFRTESSWLGRESGKYIPLGSRGDLRSRGVRLSPMRCRPRTRPCDRLLDPRREGHSDGCGLWDGSPPVLVLVILALPSASYAMKINAPNRPAAGKAGIALQVAIARHWPGLPKPGC